MTGASTEVARSPLAKLFDPTSIAVVGASADLNKPGGRCLAFLQQFGFEGELYAVNPRVEQIGDVQCFPSVAALPEPVDLMIVIVGAELVPDLIEDAGRRGVGSAVILSSGFREAGRRGAALEQRVKERAAHYGMALLGPNCLGYVDVAAGVPATFTTALHPGVVPEPGPIAFVSQSGAMGAAIFGLAQAEDVGLGTFVSTGNEVSLGLADVVDHLRTGAATVLLGYIEGVSDGRALVRAVRGARAEGKDVALVKVGSTDAGQRAARSHTGAIAGAERVWEAALHRAGALRARSPRDLLDLAVALQTPRRPTGPALGVVSMSGGAGVMMADRAEGLALDVAPLREATRKRLRAVLPGFAAIDNPVDFGGVYGDPAAIEAAVRAVADDPGVHSVVLFLGLSPMLGGQIEQRLAAIAHATAKPLVVAWLGGPPGALRELRRLGLPAYDDPVRAVEIVAALRDSAEGLQEDLACAPGGEPATSWLSGRNGELTELEVKQLLGLYGLATPREQLVTSPEQARRVAAEFDHPLAVKVQAPGLVHKSDFGGVLLGVAAADVTDAYERVQAGARTSGAEPTGVVLAPMAPAGGIELLLGSRWDPQFGPIVVIGSGGVYSEVEDDACVELAPVSPARAREMLASLRLAPRLAGFRGAPPADVQSAAEAIAAVSQLAADAGPVLRELDVNPLRVYRTGVLVLDAAAILEMQP